MKFYVPKYQDQSKSWIHQTRFIKNQVLIREIYYKNKNENRDTYLDPVLVGKRRLIMTSTPFY